MKGITTHPLPLEEIRMGDCLIDADSLIYAACFMAQKEESPHVSHARQFCKVKVKRILDLFDTESVDVRLWLTKGSTVFRNQIATIKPYKSGRKARPEFYEDIRDYLMSYYGAVIIEGIEAEDAVGIAMLGEYKDKGVCVAVDKDTLQIPGVHYDFVKNQAFMIDEENANRAFWHQVLTGDPIDSIVGIPCVGDTKAADMLKSVMTNEQGWAVASEAYYEAFGKQRCYKKQIKGVNANGEPKTRYTFGEGSGLERHDGTYIEWREALIENCKLVHLLRYEGDEWTPPA